MTVSIDYLGAEHEEIVLRLTVLSVMVVGDIWNIGACADDGHWSGCLLLHFNPTLRQYGKNG